MSRPAETWTILKVLEWTAGHFQKKGIESPRLDAEVLLSHVLSVTRVALYTHFDKPLEADELARYRELIRRRLEGQPVAYLVGEKEFWSLAFQVDPRVLIPRRDTETLVESALEAARPLGAPRLADVGAGSGAVVGALAKELPEARLWATELSEEALALCRENLERLGLADRVELIRADLLEGIEGPFDLVVSNPPYVPSAQIDTLPPEVRAEPRMALDGGPDGLDVIRRLVPQARQRLAPGGWLLLEHGDDQGPAVARLFEASGFRDVTTRKDLGGRDRVTQGRTGT